MRCAGEANEHTFVSDSEVVGFVSPATGRIGYDSYLYAVAKRRVNKRLSVLATGTYGVAGSSRLLLFHHCIHLHVHIDKVQWRH